MFSGREGLTSFENMDGQFESSFELLNESTNKSGSSATKTQIILYTITMVPYEVIEKSPSEASIKCDIYFCVKDLVDRLGPGNVPDWHLFCWSFISRAHFFATTDDQL